MIVSLIALILKILGKTLRIRIEKGSELIDDINKKKLPVIMNFWHNRLFFFCSFYANRFVKKGLPVTTLVSLSKDGDFATAVAQKFKSEVIRGSSSRAGAKALLQMVRTMRKKGRSIIMLPDGPRGPAYEYKPGAIYLASLNRSPIYLFGCTMEKKWVLNSWDSMCIPKPFSKVIVKVDGPILLPQNMSEKQILDWRNELAKRMMILSDDNPPPKNRLNSVVNR